MLAVLDSTVLIDFLRGRPAVERVAHLHRSGDVPATTAINVEEIIRGMRPSEGRVVDLLIDGLVVVAVDADCARTAGKWRRDHARRGRTLSQADCLIAAVTKRHGGRLCTGNPKDFPMLKADHWPVGA